MATIQEQIAQAKSAGYSDADIAAHLSAKPDYAPKFKAAVDAGYKPEEIISHLSGSAEKPVASAKTSPDFFSMENLKNQVNEAKSNAGNLVAGGVRGAGSIGATLMYPIDKATDLIKGDRDPGIKGLVTGKQPLSRNEERRAEMNAALREMGADPDSWRFQGGKLAAEIAGTSGTGKVLGTIAEGMGAAPTVVNALSSSGFSTGAKLADNAGKIAKGVDMAARIGGGATTGAVSAGLVDPNSAGTGAAIGGLLPPAVSGVGKVGSAVGKGVANALRGGGVSDEVRQLATRAKELGIDIPADRLVNSKPLNAVASTLNYIPFSGRAATELRMENQLTRAATKTFGQDSPNMTQALRKAGDELGMKFDDVLKNNGVNFTKKFMDDVVGVFNTAEKELGADSLKAIKSQVEELITKGESGVIDGKAAYNIKRTLDRIGKRNAPEAFHALELKRALMDGLNDSIGPEAAKAFAKTREQYGNMLALEKLAKNGADGDISVARLANLQNINNKPLQEIADIAAQFVKPRESQHGAMQRAVVGLSGATLGGPLGVAAGAVTGRTANSLLNSSHALKFLMKEPGSQGAISSGVSNLADQAAPALYRAAPVVGTSR
jgi:hypothetical protein